MPLLDRLCCAALFLLLAGGPVRAAAPPVNPDGTLPSLAPLLEQITPAVVNIAVLSASPEQDNPLMQDPFFRRFFGLPDQPQPRMAAGSGVVVDAAAGYILTNHHVIQGAREVMVTLKDRRQLQARIVGSDAGTDIALLQIKADNLKALTFGDSDGLRVGDYVLAIGNPFGLGQTVTSGIVSALGRSGLNVEGYEDFIQTDAAINPGNSGGALVNLRGELIGINSAIFGPGGGSVGIGFAVPSRMARAVMAQLIKYGEMRRGRFGASSQDLTPDLAQALGLSMTEGVVIVEVAPGGPAERAGLRRGDVVTHVNGHAVKSSADLRNQVGLLTPGEVVELRVVRDGQPRTVRARIESITSSRARGAEPVPELTGAAVGDSELGVLVVSVEPHSPAWERGLREGDIVAGVNRRPVRSASELVATLSKASRPIMINVVRGDHAFAIVLR
ncbi:MAG TPA: Do family serine endopeptidase [Steroidobacteraceae bacterium]|nr:Do family serine endopeptidase [Steroidobacteraceae bacterium]